MAEDMFKISIIDGALNICRQNILYPNCSTDDLIRQLRIGPSFQSNYDYENAKVLIEKAGWDSFIYSGTRHYQLIHTLKNLVLFLKPFWARVSYLGRYKVINLLNDDQKQCLRFAGLLDDSPTSEVIKWWEEVGNFFRSVDEQRKAEIGREGEQLTIQYETERLESEGVQLKPQWRSINDNTLGYDVSSYNKLNDDEVTDLFIEVKACTYSPTHFILTRNEWNVAKRNLDKFLFHIWNLEKNELNKLNVEEMYEHVPNDMGLGQWKTLEITFRDV